MSNIEIKKDCAILESPKLIQDLVVKMPEYAGMLSIINSNLPEIQKGKENFNKTQSQFMDNMLTVSHPTPLRNARQILAEMNKSELALKEAYISVYKKEVEIEIKKRDLEKEEDDLKQKLIQLDILDLHTKLEATKSSIGGAIRKLTNYSEQYTAILDKHGLKEFTEEDFEKEEEKYHIMKAFDQGITAARSRGGVIDEGNMIYFTQIGINGGSAQKSVFDYLSREGRILKEGQDPSHEMYLSFLSEMADKYKNSSIVYANKKGMSEPVTKAALIGYKDE